jgi:hypothetical protein
VRLDGGTFHRGGGLGAAPDAGDDDHFAGFADGGEAAPGAGLGEVAALREQQFGEPLALDDGARRHPGQHARRDDVEDVPGRFEGDADEPEQEDPRHEHAEEHADLDERQRHGQPQVVQLVEPLLDAPDVGVRG